MILRGSSPNVPYLSLAVFLQKEVKRWEIMTRAPGNVYCCPYLVLRSSASALQKFQLFLESADRGLSLVSNWIRNRSSAVCRIPFEKKVTLKVLRG